MLLCRHLVLDMRTSWNDPSPLPHGLRTAATHILTGCKQVKTLVHSCLGRRSFRTRLRLAVPSISLLGDYVPFGGNPLDLARGAGTILVQGTEGDFDWKVRGQHYGEKQTRHQGAEAAGAQQYIGGFETEGRCCSRYILATTSTTSSVRCEEWGSTCRWG
jgi:hypothetical protein